MKIIILVISVLALTSARSAPKHVDHGVNVVRDSFGNYRLAFQTEDEAGHEERTVDGHGYVASRNIYNSVGVQETPEVAEARQMHLDAVARARASLPVLVNEDEDEDNRRSQNRQHHEYSQHERHRQQEQHRLNEQHRQIEEHRQNEQRRQYEQNRQQEQRRQNEQHRLHEQHIEHLQHAERAYHTKKVAQPTKIASRQFIAVHDDTEEIMDAKIQHQDAHNLAISSFAQEHRQEYQHLQHTQHQQQIQQQHIQREHAKQHVEPEMMPEYIPTRQYISILDDTDEVKEAKVQHQEAHRNTIANLNQERQNNQQRHHAKEMQYTEQHIQHPQRPENPQDYQRTQQPQHPQHIQRLHHSRPADEEETMTLEFVPTQFVAMPGDTDEIIEAKIQLQHAHNLAIASLAQEYIALAQKS